MWIDNSRLMIKNYYKSLDLQQPFTALDLLESQPYHSLDDSSQPVPESDFELLK